MVSLEQREAGALVISLDLELRWGVRDLVPPGGAYEASLLGARAAVPALLAEFQAYGIAATWAAVGFLLAATLEERERHSPLIRPTYTDPRLDPYAERTGPDEAADPLHYGRSLADAIQAVPRQELGTHTFSHYYCLEPGQDAAMFRADLEAAVAIGRERGSRPRSIVFPRNQHNPAYDGILRELGITVYRGNQRGWMHGARQHSETALLSRAARLADAYFGVTGSATFPWSAIPQDGGLLNVPATLFLRPASRRLRHLESLRRRRITAAIRHAARTGRVVHLWWHPHNFGADLELNMGFLRSLLDVFARCREEEGMRSLGMADAAGVITERTVAP